ncbi:MAG TPA: CRTAC1 family protein [Thermoanaerobaculia bacterium]|nr:CRTAC1 family protein [Thermoanaerobaculia bacterium]
MPFRHVAGGSGGKHLPETMGAGLAWIDYDGDGWLDLYLVQSGPYPPAGSAEAANRLFRNRGGEGFEEVPASGTEHTGYGQGVLALDLDGDGATDLIVTNVGATALLRNRGDGTFEDASGRLGEPASPRAWGSSVAAADAEGDGDLDLYVAQYLDYDPEAELFCGDRATGERDYCDPAMFEGLRDHFFRNRGDGSFEEVGRQVGLGGADGKGLGVIFGDLDGSGRPDLYVANDLTLNLLFRNRGDGVFEDLSLLSGAAVNAHGRPEAGMGVIMADLDGDGDPDLAVSNFDVETNTLYRNLGGLSFEDASSVSGFGLPSFNLLGFGLIAADFDLDGALDVFVANGHIFERPRRENVSYRQRDLLLRGDGRGRFAEVRCAALESAPRVGRGAAAADFDLDGDVDLAVANNDDGPTLLINRIAEMAHPGWLGVELVGGAPNTEAIGAVVTLRQGDRAQRRWVLAGDSYLSSGDRRVVFGLADRDAPLVLDVDWPSGKHQRVVAPSSGRYLRLVE